MKCNYYEKFYRIIIVRFEDLSLGYDTLIGSQLIRTVFLESLLLSHSIISIMLLIINYKLNQKRCVSLFVLKSRINTGEDGHGGIKSLLCLSFIRIKGSKHFMVRRFSIQ